MYLTHHRATLRRSRAFTPFRSIPRANICSRVNPVFRGEKRDDTDSRNRHAKSYANVDDRPRYKIITGHAMKYVETRAIIRRLDITLRAPLVRVSAYRLR